MGKKKKFSKQYIRDHNRDLQYWFKRRIEDQFEMCNEDNDVVCSDVFDSNTIVFNAIVNQYSSNYEAKRSRNIKFIYCVDNTDDINKEFIAAKIDTIGREGSLTIYEEKLCFNSIFKDTYNTIIRVIKDRAFYNIDIVKEEDNLKFAKNALDIAASKLDPNLNISDNEIFPIIQLVSQNEYYTTYFYIPDRFDMLLLSMKTEYFNGRSSIRDSIINSLLEEKRVIYKENDTDLSMVMHPTINLMS